MANRHSGNPVFVSLYICDLSSSVSRNLTITMFNNSEYYPISRFIWNIHFKLKNIYKTE